MLNQKEVKILDKIFLKNAKKINTLRSKDKLHELEEIFEKHICYNNIPNMFKSNELIKFTEDISIDKIGKLVEYFWLFHKGYYKDTYHYELYFVIYIVSCIIKSVEHFNEIPYGIRLLYVSEEGKQRKYSSFTFNLLNDFVKFIDEPSNDKELDYLVKREKYVANNDKNFFIKEQLEGKDKIVMFDGELHQSYIFDGEIKLWIELNKNKFYEKPKPTKLSDKEMKLFKEKNNLNKTEDKNDAQNLSSENV